MLHWLLSTPQVGPNGEKPAAAVPATPGATARQPSAYSQFVKATYSVAKAAHPPGGGMMQNHWLHLKHTIEGLRHHSTTQAVLKHRNTAVVHTQDGLACSGDTLGIVWGRCNAEARFCQSHAHRVPSLVCAT
jgi:hypothetical protein